MNVLITGGAGFIGSHLADRLLARGDDVLVIDNYATGRRDNLTPHLHLTVIEGSIADAALVNDAFATFHPDQVIHAAASYKDPANWIEDIQTNIAGTANIAQAAMQSGIQRMIYFQTALCYGLHPLEQPITLNHPIRPEGSSYAFSKTAAEQYLTMSGLPVITFRLANAYGPRNLSGPLPTFFSRLTQQKPCFVMDTRRDFIFVQDLVDVVVKAIDGRGRTGAYHISSGRDYSIKDLYDAVIAALEITPATDVEVRPRGADDAYTILLDPTQTNQDFDWAISTPLATGVAAAICWYEQYGITQTFTHLQIADMAAKQ